jgi:hypothetical protein
MAEQHTINPRIMSRTRDLLRQACEERRASQGALVEAALLAFLTPQQAETTTDLVWQQLTAMDTALVDIVALLRILIDHREAQAHEYDLVVQRFAALDTTLGDLGAQFLAAVKPQEPEIEFIPIKPLAATGSSAPGSWAGHSRVPSPDRGRLLAIGGCGL